MKRRPKRILRGAVLAFALAAIIAPNAQAKPGPLNLGPSARVESSTYAPQQIRALQLWSQGMNARYGVVQKSAPATTSASAPLLVTASDGFNWGDAFAGAAATLATALILAFAAVSVRRTRQPVRA